MTFNVGPYLGRASDASLKPKRQLEGMQVISGMLVQCAQGLHALAMCFEPKLNVEDLAESAIRPLPT
jgi:hypothetical protein